MKDKEEKVDTTNAEIKEPSWKKIYNRRVKFDVETKHIYSNVKIYYKNIEGETNTIIGKVISTFGLGMKESDKNSASHAVTLYKIIGGALIHGQIDLLVNGQTVEINNIYKIKIIGDE